ncbi:TonB-dependent receptor [Sphingobacterium spiritivorum]|uniref:TonB-dependent receptor n=1 Tax=Sphingobacterium spiritivorum TaxID=258 RepID=UPI001919846C|nr:TonB-dependent receptor [Sphingobacterium spiritivorum]QQT25529.1 TonB-dependent receptor [Sphingobacterium spiritivorum]
MRNTIFGLKKPDPAFSFKAGRHSGYRYLMNALILISLLQLNTTATAQKISLSESNISVEKVVKTLKAKTGYDFFYVNSHLTDTSPVSIRIRDGSIREVLDELVKNQPLAYEIKGNTVVLRRRALTKNQEVAPKAAKSASVTGYVKDEKREPLPNVVVRVKENNNTVQTDASGKFTINVEPGQTLIFRHISYQAKEIIYSGQSALNVQLSAGNTEISEVTVIGYGTIKSKNVTGAIAKVEARDLNVSVAPSFLQSLQGKAAGVQVLQETGQPGAGVKVQIRSNPSSANAGVLYVLDGIPINDNAGQPNLAGGIGSKYVSGGVDKSPLNFINPNDLESIQFLKDASAASIYGARAGAGVVLLTTKKGRNGKSAIEYSGSYGIQNVDKMYEVYGTKEYMKRRNQVKEELWYMKNGVGPYYGTKDPSAVKDPFKPVYTQQQIDNATEGQTATEAISRKGYTQQHNIFMSGGNDKTHYFASGNYFDQRGVLIATDYKRYNVRINLEHQVSDKINIGANVIMSNSLANNTVTNGRYENGGIVTAAIYWSPDIPLRDDKGGYPISPYYANIPNPLSYATVTDLTKAKRILTNAFGEWKIIDGLKAKASFSYDQSTSKRSNYFPRTFLYGSQSNGSATIAESESQSKLLEYTLNYDKNIGELHHLNAVAGYSFQKTNWEGFNAGNQKFLSDATSYYNLSDGGSDKPTVGSYKGETIWASYFARAIYTYRDNITLQASIRRDGSTVFAKNKKWGYFPAVSAGWVLSDEVWLKDSKTLPFLKLRAGYGETGNSSFGASAFELYRTGVSTYFGNNMVSPGLAKIQDANPNLTWETAGEFNIGTDFALFDNRLSGSVDYFNKTIRNLIVFIPYPKGFIVDGVFGNAGKTRSAGYEISLESKNIRPHDGDGCSWSTRINLSHYKNYWLERTEMALKALQPYQVATGSQALYRPIYGYIADGFFTGKSGEAPAHMPGMLPGGVIIKDINGFDSNGKLTGQPDGKITDADMTLLGNAEPALNFGIGNTFHYKGFDLNIYFSGLKQKRWSPVQGISGGDVSLNSFGWNAMPTKEQQWSVFNTNGTLPTALDDPSYGRYQGSSTYWLIDGTFLRARNITLGYSFPSSWISKQKVFSSLRVSFDVQNAFTITKYPMFDPELNRDNFYPMVRSYVFGLNASF